MKPSVFLVEIWVLNEVDSLVLNGSFLQWKPVSFFELLKAVDQLTQAYGMAHKMITNLIDKPIVAYLSWLLLIRWLLLVIDGTMQSLNIEATQQGSRMLGNGFIVCLMFELVKSKE